MNGYSYEKLHNTHIVRVYCGVLGYGKRLPTACIFTANLKSWRLKSQCVTYRTATILHTRQQTAPKVLQYTWLQRTKPQECHVNSVSPKIYRNDTLHFKVGKSTEENAGRKCWLWYKWERNLIYIWQHFYFVFSIWKQLTLNSSIQQVWWLIIPQKGAMERIFYFCVTVPLYNTAEV